MTMRTPLGKVRGLGSAKSGAEHWLLERVAQVVLDLPDAESRAEFWQPILSTAPHGAHWIEVFAAALLSSAGADAQGTAAFIDTWPRIVGWALVGLRFALLRVRVRAVDKLRRSVTVDKAVSTGGDELAEPRHRALQRNTPDAAPVTATRNPRVVSAMNTPAIA